jgi:pilus assembly protein CpaE
VLERVSARILLVTLGESATDRIADPLIVRGWDVQAVSGTTAAGQALADRDMVIVDAFAPGAAAEACRRLRSRVGPDMPILAVAPSDSLEDRIALFEAGADDVLASDFKVPELEAMADALLARRRPPPPSGEGHGDELPSRPGRLIVFAGARGGAGTTTLAVNTALLVAERGGAVAIADLDLHHGQVGTHLDVSGPNSTAHLARDEQIAGNPVLVRNSAVRHASGLSVFAAPTRPDHAGLVTVDDVLDLVGAMRRAYGTVVVDAGSVAGTRAISLFAMADCSFMLVTPDIPGLRAVQGAIEALNDAGATGEQTRFVLNQPFEHAAIDGADIERHFNVQLALEIPYDGENCMRAVNEGQPVSALAPRAPITGALRRLTALALGQEMPPEEVAADNERKGRLLGGLRRRG